MSYNVENFPKFVNTAGKITVLTAVVGVAVFFLAFLFNAGTNELMKVEATSTASTTLTVLNTPPQWTINAQERFESSTSSPTNSSYAVYWTAVGTDSNSQPYFLIICSTSATPTANDAIDYSNLGTAPPNCNGGTQWAVSASTTSGAPAYAATTTTESFAELNDWYAWVCDDDPVNPRCSTTYTQGVNATNSSPFHVNHRPVFTFFYSDTPKDPGAVLTFYSTSTDPDTTGGEDNIVLHVCNENDYSTTTAQCGAGGTIASTTIPVTQNATAAYTLPSVIQDQLYDAYGFLVDEHGHAASGGDQGANPGFTVNNVAPTVSNGSIVINGGSDIELTNPAGESTGYTLDFTISDANSCENAASGDEITGSVVSLFKTSVGSSTCDGSAGSYNPNNCYPSGVATTTWNLSCTASSTSCGGPTDPTVEWSCTYPLWFLTDPTDATSPFDATTWSAAVSGVDDDSAIGPFTVSTSTVDVLTFPALDLLTAEIPYGALEPGTNNPTLTASTSIQAVGNAGLDQNLEGESMCITFSLLNPCPVSATSTVPEDNQHFATSSVAYASGFSLSSTTPYELEINVLKTTSTSTYESGITYWGTAVPAAITLAGAYTGLNTFMAVVSEASEW